MFSKRIVFLLEVLFLSGLPAVSMGQEIREEGWPIPDLKGLIPYTISVRLMDGVEKIVEKFQLDGGGHVARISGNGKVFAYAVDSDQEPPIDYLLLDPIGNGNFAHKVRSEESFALPEWVLNGQSNKGLGAAIQSK